MSDVINGEILGNLIFVLRSVGLLSVQVTKLLIHWMCGKTRVLNTVTFCSVQLTVVSPSVQGGMQSEGIQIRAGHAPIFADAHRCASDAHRCAYSASLIKKIALAPVVILRCILPQWDLRSQSYKCFKTIFFSRFILMHTKFNCTLGHSKI